MADEEPLTASALPKDEASDRFYKKGVEFAYSNIGGASSSVDDDDYDEDPGATLPLPARTDQSEAVAENSQSVEKDGGLQVAAGLMETSLASEPGQRTDAATKQETSALDNHSMESQDSGIGSQTPSASLEESPLPPPPEAPDISDTGTRQPATDFEGDFSDLPDNMSLDELHAKVKKWFPGFKPNSILRFSSLLGPGKPSSLPKRWSEAKKPQKRKKSNKPVELKLDCDFIPPDHMINTDDEVAR